MMSEMKLQSVASVTPVRAMSCTCAEQRKAACATQAEGGDSGRDHDGVEAAGGGERPACKGDELRVRRAMRGGLCRPSRGREQRLR